MSNIINIIFQEKRNRDIAKGLKSGKVFPYPMNLIDRLRPFHYGGFPLSIMMMINELCNGKCYDRAKLMSLAFSDAKVVYADIESLRLSGNKKSGERYAEHAFVETEEFGGGKTWVIDTSAGLIFEKKFFYDLENVSINYVFSKEELMKTEIINSVLTSNFENDKYALVLTLPLIEQAVKESNWFSTIIYREVVTRELERFKKAINYDSIQADVDEDIAIMYDNPSKLDEKFQIVRDEHFREISRGGVPNPYYVSFEELAERNAKYEAVKNNPEEYRRLIEEDMMAEFERMMAEEEELHKIAMQRLEEILLNPTANFYETQPCN